jgi:hypothetical protein
MKTLEEIRNEIWSQSTGQICTYHQIQNQINKQTRFRDASLMSDQMSGNVFDQIWGYILREYVKK